MLRSKISWLVLVPLALCSVHSWSAGPPADVAAAFEAAIMVEDDEEFIGSFGTHTTTTVQKPNGKARHDMEIVVDVERRSQERMKRTLISFMIDGEDATEENRKEIESEDDADSNDDSDFEETDADFVAPWGKDADRYHYDPPTRSGHFVEQSFRPKPGSEDDEGLGRGILRWHATTLDPVAIELELTAPPKPFKEVELRLDFERQCGTIYVTRMITDGLLQVLLMKREIHIELQWNNIKPELISEPK